MMTNDTCNGNSENALTEYNPISFRKAVRNEAGKLASLRQEVVLMISPWLNEKFFKDLIFGDEAKAELMMLAFADAVVVFQEALRNDHGVVLRCSQEGIQFNVKGSAVFSMHAVLEADGTAMAALRTNLETYSAMFVAVVATEMAASGVMFGGGHA
ncbi:hypothetical protein [Pseudorhizobium flavum]|uniref:hypothetical protein n=1 Tax=Pseudorhizobium flavum TaxID=1335061 RepID=UPI0037702278